MNKRRNDNEKICNLHIRNRPSYILTTFHITRDLDRFNPIAEEKCICRCERIWCSGLSSKGKAMYSLKAVDELSNEKEYNVGTNTPNDFIRKTYLKIHVKGKYVYSYDIISKEDIPEKIRGQLEIANK